MAQGSRGARGHQSMTLEHNSIDRQPRHRRSFFIQERHDKRHCTLRALYILTFMVFCAWLSHPNYGDETAFLMSGFCPS